ncbi:endonuclease/exonuclease/phosphatase family protein [candidate division WOR-3 bacterium]|nr:endonuclease/exonuclease/phosphatase family protein [candidate division WOR-3 bacterium]
MPLYYRLDKATPEGKRTAAGLLRLREQMKEIPPKDISGTLLLATWNIREFDSAKYGPRLDEACHYLAEVISHFDLVAIQEVRDDLKPLQKLRSLLGSWWGYLVTDVTAGVAGNQERLAYVFDGRKVRLSGVAGEVVIPPIKQGNKEVAPSNQLARTPYLCGFKAGWSRFNLCTVHIVYGKSKADDPERVKEIRALCQFLASRAKKDAGREENLIILGDFNIFSRKDATMGQITEAGFQVPKELQELKGSNVGRNKHYDQIAFMVNEKMLGFTGRAGVLDFYESVFRSSEEADYLEIARRNQLQAKPDKQLPEGKWPGKGYLDWRTYQMSDHLPMWVQLKIDFCDEYLERRAGV